MSVKMSGWNALGGLAVGMCVGCGGQSQDAHQDAATGGSTVSVGQPSGSSGSIATGGAGDVTTTSANCPETEPAADQLCLNAGLDCTYSICSGVASRTWSCNAGRWIVTSDESAQCVSGSSCPPEPPIQLTQCSVATDCSYTIDCCGTPGGTLTMSCTGVPGIWHVSSAATIACPQCSPFPTGGTECSSATTCVNGAPPAMCFQPGCEGGTASARCVDSRWVIDPGCQK